MNIHAQIKKYETDNGLSKIFPLTSFFRFFSKGESYKPIAVWFIRSATILSILVFCVYWILGLFKILSNISMIPGSIAFFIIIIMLSLIGLMYVLANVMIMKSNDIAAVNSESGFVLISIASVLIRLVGTLLAIVIIYFGLLEFLVSILFENSVLKVLNSIVPMMQVSSYIPFYSLIGSGLASLLITIILSVFWLMAANFFAELLTAVYYIAVNAKNKGRL